MRSSSVGRKSPISDLRFGCHSPDEPVGAALSLLAASAAVEFAAGIDGPYADILLAMVSSYGRPRRVAASIDGRRRTARIRQRRVPNQRKRAYSRCITGSLVHPHRSLLIRVGDCKPQRRRMGAPFGACLTTLLDPRHPPGAREHPPRRPPPGDIVANAIIDSPEIPPTTATPAGEYCATPRIQARWLDSTSDAESVDRGPKRYTDSKHDPRDGAVRRSRTQSR